MGARRERGGRRDGDARLIVEAAGERLLADTETRVREALLRDALIIFPTDTLYALGGLALRPAASRAVREAKGREEGKPLPVVAADLDQVRALCELPAGGPAALAEAFWPGPLTLVLPVRAGVPDELTAATGTIAVRVPSRDLTRALCRLAGPLISTSANRSGEPAPETCADAVRAVGGADVLAIDGGRGAPQPSTIVDATGTSPRLLRAGAVAWEEVRQIWS